MSRARHFLLGVYRLFASGAVELFLLLIGVIILVSVVDLDGGWFGGIWEESGEPSGHIGVELRRGGIRNEQTKNGEWRSERLAFSRALCVQNQILR